MVFIYVLCLEENKYYVGKTNNPQFRLYKHFNGNGSYWTKKYAPIKIHKIYSSCDDYDEDKYTIKMMNKFGICNVRGGSFSRSILSKQELIIIYKMICNAQNLCFNCGNSHFILDCDYKKKLIDIELLVLKHEILRQCCILSLTSQQISAQIMKNILEKTDNIMFNDITEHTIITLNKHMQQNNTINNTSIDYQTFTNNFILLLNDNFYNTQQ